MSVGPLAPLDLNASQRIVDHLRERGAVASASSAPIPPDMLGQRALERLVSRSVVVEVYPGRYYLNEIALAFNNTADRTKTRLSLTLALSTAVALVAAWWIKSL